VVKISTCRYIYFVLEIENLILLKKPKKKQNRNHSDSTKMNSETEIINVISLTNSTLGDYNHVLFSFVINHRICNKSSTTGATIGTRASYPSGATVFCILLTNVFLLVIYLSVLLGIAASAHEMTMKTYLSRIYVDSLVYKIKRI
jgi:hypothetical protein